MTDVLVLLGCGLQLGAALLALVLALAARRRARRFQRQAVRTVGRPGPVAVVVPALHADAGLGRCLRSIAAQRASGLVQVIVVLQGGGEARASVLRMCPAGVPVEVLDTGGLPCKAAAVRVGLRRVRADWVVLLDSDTAPLPDALDRLTGADDGCAVHYGLVLPVPAGRRSLLQQVVELDKAVSHGLFRLGRFALGLWPNLPGQCYAIRAPVVGAIYGGEMGYLDDLVVTLRLAALAEPVGFVPAAVAAEESRQTWRGFVLQRTRWTLGQAQALLALRGLEGNRRRALLGWLLHVWLYYGWPLTAAATGGLFLLAGHGWLALAVGLSHGSVWGALAWQGRNNLSRIDPAAEGRFIPAWVFLAAVLVLTALPCLGALIALAVGGGPRRRPRRLTTFLYAR